MSHHEIKKLIINTSKVENTYDLLLNLRFVDSFDREVHVTSANLTIGDEIVVSFGIEKGFKLFEKDKYN